MLALHTAIEEATRAIDLLERTDLQGRVSHAFVCRPVAPRWAHVYSPRSRTPEMQRLRPLKDTLSLEDPGWQDIRDAMILSRAEAEVGDEDSVGPALEIALEQHPNNPLLLSLAALRRHSSGDTDGAEDLFLEGR